MCYHLSQEDNFCFAFFLFDQHATFPALSVHVGLHVLSQKSHLFLM